MKHYALQSSVEESEPRQVAEMRTRGRVRSGVYRAYCAAGGNCLITLIVLSVFILAQLAVSVGDYWMSFWYVCLVHLHWFCYIEHRTLSAKTCFCSL
jgi:hypothetical protein